MNPSFSVYFSVTGGAETPGLPHPQQISLALAEESPAVPKPAGTYNPSTNSQVGPMASAQLPVLCKSLNGGPHEASLSSAQTPTNSCSH